MLLSTRCGRGSHNAILSQYLSPITMFDCYNELSIPIYIVILFTCKLCPKVKLMS